MAPSETSLEQPTRDRLDEHSTACVSPVSLASQSHNWLNLAPLLCLELHYTVTLLVYDIILDIYAAYRYEHC